MLTKKYQLMYWQFKVGCRSLNFKFQAQKHQGHDTYKKAKIAKKITKEIKPTLATKIQNITTNHGLFY